MMSPVGQPSRSTGRRGLWPVRRMVLRTGGPACIREEGRAAGAGELQER